MDNPNRAFRWWRIRTGSRPETSCSQNPGPQPRRPPGPFLQTKVTFSLPRPFWWLLAGIAIGHILLPNGLLQKASLLLRTLLTR